MPKRPDGQRMGIEVAFLSIIYRKADALLILPGYSIYQMLGGKSTMTKHIPNILSVSRIPLALSLFFVTRTPVWFIIIYALCGLTDLLDGYIARRFRLQSDIGAKLDTIGDTTLIIVIASSILVFPWIMSNYMPWIRYAITENLGRILIFVAIIIFVKLLNVVYIKIKFKEFNSVHTIFNKLIAVPIFIAVPVCVAMQRIPNFLIEIICVMMIAAFLEETFIVIRMKEFKVNTKSVFTIKDAAVHEQCPPEQPDMVIYSKKFKHNIYKLDIASFVYPILAKKDFNDIYRIGFALQSNIDPEKLQEAVNDLAPRFPSFYVQLKKGFFWYFFRPAADRSIVGKDDGVACRPFVLFKSNKPLFRVLYDDKNISVEFFHCVTDGLSALNYLKTLTARYLELCGKTIEKNCGVFDITQAPAAHEFEDSYRSSFTKDKLADRKEPNAYQYNTGFSYKNTTVVSGTCEIDALKAVAKRHNSTITEFMLSLCGFLLLEYKRAAKNAEKSKKLPVILNSAIDLRPVFGSKTLHNFVMLANLNTELSGASPNSVEEVARVLKPQFQSEWGRETLQSLINVNVKTALSPIAKIAPLFIKKPVTKIGAILFGERKHTANITNLGLLRLPRGLEDEVVDAFAMIGPTVTNGLNAIAVGYNNKFRITFSCASGAADVPLSYFKKLEEYGIETEVEVRQNETE